MSNRHNAVDTISRVRSKPKLPLPPHPAVEPTWVSVNGAAQARVVPMTASDGNAQRPTAASDRASS